MNMSNYFDEIKDKIKNNISIEKVEILDNSQKHKKHKFFSPDKFHLKLNIKSKYLNSISRINAQNDNENIKKIFKIHALEINIEQ